MMTETELIAYAEDFGFGVHLPDGWNNLEYTIMPIDGSSKAVFLSVKTLDTINACDFISFWLLPGELNLDSISD